MRKEIVLGLVLASLGLVQPAFAVPVVHHVRILALTHASVTCDTSGYPAALYPCSFSAVAGGEPSCYETTSEYRFSSACVVTVTGTLYARPSVQQNGRCMFQDNAGPFTLKFDSGVDPAYHVTRLESIRLVQSVAVYYGDIGTTTQATVEVIPPASAPPYGADVLSMGFAFSDIQSDCRTRAGGDPTSDVEGATNVRPAPIGSLTFIRT